MRESKSEVMLSQVMKHIVTEYRLLQAVWFQGLNWLWFTKPLTRSGRCLMKVGNLRGSCKDEVGAIVAFQKTLETGERLYDKGERDLLVATCYSYFGHYLCGLKHRGRGWREEFHDFGKGLQMLRQSYALSQDLGNAHLQLHGLRNLARAESNAGNTAEARDYFEKAALLFEEPGQALLAADRRLAQQFYSIPCWKETPEQMAWWVLAVPSWLQGPRALWLLCGKYQINPL
ncbi:unnamed protein product [Durusdinium trenchii]|uniref:Tetratricopeptide repeat protein 29 n=1 Tax=Durusdinium trenchii TaxID=1381693 RepID=A0ABP0MXK8_9DINO